MGTRSAGSRWWSPLRVLLLLTALCFAAGMVQKSGCYADNWTSTDVRYSQMCYSDLPYLYTGRGMSELAWPYTEDETVRSRFQVMEYPVGISYVAWAAGWATHWATGSPDLAERRAQEAGALFGTDQGHREIRAFVGLQAVGLGLLALLTVGLLAGVDQRRPWDAAAFALSPLLALTGIINWDLLAVVLVGAALWAWARDRAVLTGVLIGLGAATKLYPLFLLGAILVICVRQKRWRELGLASVAAAAAWVAANAPAYLTGPEPWKVFWSFNSERAADLGSIWFVLQQASGTTITAPTINHWSWAFFGLWCVGVLVVGLKAPATPRLAQLAFLVVAGFLLVNKVYSPQYVLWLLPLAALARPRWRDQLIWQGTELVYFASVWWYLGNQLAPADGGGAGFYWAAILLRLAGELYLVVLVTRDVLRPSYDVARDPVDPDRAFAPASANAPTPAREILS
ncbi:MAG: glycosyltransferase 87 family protein [Nocardioides sp.]|nr:glycosyltransferase 87 family protein [Nocardioides sp.]